MVEFSMETGTHNPIAQRPYNTPLSLRESVDEEIDWLLSKGYMYQGIRESLGLTHGDGEEARWLCQDMH